jgi:hypothetical protein
MSDAENNSTQGSGISEVLKGLLKESIGSKDPSTARKVYDQASTLVNEHGLDGVNDTIKSAFLVKKMQYQDVPDKPGSGLSPEELEVAKKLKLLSDE